MRAIRIKTIERHRLSDGTLTTISKIGRGGPTGYAWLHTSNEWLDPGEAEHEISLDRARELLANTLRADVMEEL